MYVQLGYTVTTTAFTVDSLTTFLQSASTLSQLTAALQTSYHGVVVSSPTVTVNYISPSESSLSSSSGSSASTIAIIAGTVCGGGGLLLLCLGCLLYYRWRKASAKNDQLHIGVDGSLQEEQPQEQQQVITLEITSAFACTCTPIYVIINHHHHYDLHHYHYHSNSRTMVETVYVYPWSQ